MPLTAYRDTAPGMSTPERGDYPPEPDPVPGDPDYTDGGDGPWSFPRLLPARWFDDRHASEVMPAAPRGSREAERYPTVQERLDSSCAGMERPAPKAYELRDAILAEDPNPRQFALIWCWLHEATEEEIFFGWYEGAYTWKTFVELCHRLGIRRAPAFREMNRAANWPRDGSLEELWNETERNAAGGDRKKKPGRNREHGPR